MSGSASGAGDGAERLLGALDVALADLSEQRPLAAAVEDMVAAVAEAFDVGHVYLHLGEGSAPHLEARAGRGLWVSETDPAIDGRVRRDGQVCEDADWAPGQLLAVAVVVDTSVVGSLGLVLDPPRTESTGSDDQGRPGWDHRAVAWLKRFGALAGVAYANARLLSTERTARQQEKALIRAGQALSATLQLRDVLRAILSELQQVVPYDTASVQELRGGQMVIVGGRGFDVDEFAGTGFDATSAGVPNHAVLTSRAPVIVDDILGDHPFWNFPHPAHEMSGVRCWLGVPLLFGQECTGMLTLDTFAPGFYTEEHADIAMAFAAQAAVALENAKFFERTRREVEVRTRAESKLRAANESLHQRMEEIESLQEHLRDQATRDALTGLFNRRYLLETLQRELARCAREARPVSVALLDIDHFKAVNDTLGHAAGDRVLESVAEVLDDGTRADDIACRYGGEEFVVVMPGTPVDVAARRARDWCDQIAAAGPLGDVSITVSVGVAQSPVHGVVAETLIRAADKAMYQAKDNGRNQVVIADHAY